MSQEKTRHHKGLINRVRLHLLNARLIGDDTIFIVPLLPLLGFFLLHGLLDIPWLNVAGLLLVSLLLTITIFGLNNVADAELDAHDPLKRRSGINPIAMGLLTHREALIPLLCCGLLALLLATWLSFLFWALLTLTTAALYSLPPARFKERIGLDLLIHGMVPLTALLMGMAVARANYPWRALIGAAWIGIISVKSETTNLIRDYESDLAQGIRTTVVRLGIRPVRWLRFVLLLAAAVLIFFAGLIETINIVSTWLITTIVVLEIVAVLRSGYFVRSQRLLFHLNYACGGLLLVLLSS
jgi:4-hydroxybenzoate polyprenyltransferase